MEKLKRISALKLYLISFVICFSSILFPEGSVLSYVLGAIGFAVFLIAIVQYFRV